MKFHLALFGLLLAGLMACPVSAQVVITGQDDFGTGFDGFGNPTGGNQLFSSRVLTPDNKGNTGFGGAPGTFGGSFFDYYGITDRRINQDVADDSAGSFPPDVIGFAGDTGSSNDCGNFIALSDIENAQNPGGIVSAQWKFNVSGPYNTHRLCMDLMAYGDFETSDQMVFSGGVTSSGTIFDLGLTMPQDDANILYFVCMDSGTTPDVFFSPFFDQDNWDCLFTLGSLPGVCPATGDTVDWHPDDDGNLITDDGIAQNGRIIEPTFFNPTGTVEAYEETNGFGTFDETEFEAYKDPLFEQVSGTQLDNKKRSFSKIFLETGSTFTLDMVCAQNSSPEVIAIDNIIVISYMSSGGSVLIGDANGDGAYNNLDISAFGDALFDPATYAADFPTAEDPNFVLDMNCDGTFNNLDISAFGAGLGF